MSHRKKKHGKNPFHQRNPTRPQEAFDYPVRLNKYIAKSGLCSRRKAVDLVKEGHVSVNGLEERLPYRLIEANDDVMVKGKLVTPEQNLVYLLLNKPKNIITTTDDENQRKTVLDLIQWKGPERIYPVGRLDRQTTGLLLITNDGDLTKKLSHPSHQVKKTYQVRLDNALSADDFQTIKNGHVLADGPVPILDLCYPEPSKMTVVEISISIGRNRIVRRLFESLGYEVLALDRTYLGGLTKKNLARGMHRELTPREVIMLKHFV